MWEDQGRPPEGGGTWAQTRAAWEGSHAGLWREGIPVPELQRCSEGRHPVISRSRQQPRRTAPASQLWCQALRLETRRAPSGPEAPSCPWGQGGSTGRASLRLHMDVISPWC